MTKKLMVAMVATLIASGMLGRNAGAAGFGPHHRGGALHSCIAVMNQTQRANLKQTFGNQHETLMTDRQNVATAHKALTSAILAGNKDLSTEEAALATARTQLQKDQDAAAAAVCGQLNSTQLNAAATLFNNLSTLHENTRQQARSYFQAAQTASGNSTDAAPVE